MKALILVDIQNDFVTGGSLAVEKGEEIIPVVNRLQQHFDLVIATQDWHPPGHKSFASSHPGKKPFDVMLLDGVEQVLWPDHCVQSSPGADFHRDLDMARVEAIFRKGMDVSIDSYSGFFDNGHRKNTGLAGYLRDRNVGQVYVAGLAGDYCVHFTADDALAEGFETFVIEEATRSISPQQFTAAMKDFTARSGHLVSGFYP